MDQSPVLSLNPLPDITKPRYDQGTFTGRARHFFSITNPANLFVSEKRMDECKEIVQNYKHGKINPNLKLGDLWRAKEIYDSAFHPDNGEKMFILGRMSAQVPCNMVITGMLLSMYRTFPGVVFSHWINQTFNAGVNYTNRSGNSKASNERLFASYCCATGGAMTAALGLNSLVKNGQGLAARLIPFVAIAVANAINIPMMRSNEVVEGIELLNDKNEVVGKSQRMAVVAVAQVTLSRIAMALPYMTLTPVIMNRIAKTAYYQKRQWLSMPIQTVLAGIGLLVTTPLCCALFPQYSSVEVKLLEKNVRDQLNALPNPPKVVRYNKGL